MSQVIGKTFSKRYRVERRIGAGGMSIVYLAEDILLNRPVAIKILREQYADDEQNIRFFQNEARSIAALSHPNIVKIFDIGKEDQIYFIVMEYLEGETLKEIIQKRAPMDPVEAIGMIRDVLRALEHSHKRGIIHRDIKPHNIIMDKLKTLKVTDFGIARNTGSSTVTYSNMMMGSVYYLSPEQAEGLRTTFATDIYSTGVMMYEMLTGRVPFTGDNPVSIALSHVEKLAKPMSYWNKSIPDCLEEIVEIAMQKDPHDRYDSALDMVRALSKARMMILNGKAKPTNRKLRLQKKWIWIGVVASFLALIPLSCQVLAAYRPIPVPDVVGLTLEDADTLLTASGFAYQIAKEIETEDFEPGTIMHQDPKAAIEVRTTREILLTMSKEPEKTVVPNVVGLEERKALIALENRNLGVKVAYEYSDGHVPIGQVLRQDPMPLSSVPLDTPVLVYISKGKQPGLITMEDLKGMTFAQGETYLREQSLLLGDISYADSPLYFLGIIMEQSVSVGDEVSAGTRVDLTISRGPGMQVQEKKISFVMPGEGESVLHVVVEDLSGMHEEYRGNHLAGEPIELVIEHLGDGIANVYQNDELIQSVSLP